MDDGDPAAARRVGRRWTVRRTLSWTWWLVGLALVVVGTLVLVSASRGSGEFGWFAYTPLTGPPTPPRLFDGGARIVSRDEQLGVAALGLGVVLLVGAVGYRIGVLTTSRRRAAEIDPT